MLLVLVAALGATNKFGLVARGMASVAYGKPLYAISIRYFHRLTSSPIACALFQKMAQSIDGRVNYYFNIIIIIMKIMDVESVA